MPTGVLPALRLDRGARPRPGRRVVRRRCARCCATYAAATAGCPATSSTARSPILGRRTCTGSRAHFLFIARERVAGPPAGARGDPPRARALRARAGHRPRPAARRRDLVRRRTCASSPTCSSPRCSSTPRRSSRRRPDDAEARSARPRARQLRIVLVGALNWRSRADSRRPVRQLRRRVDDPGRRAGPVSDRGARLR